MRDVAGQTISQGLTVSENLGAGVDGQGAGDDKLGSPLYSSSFTQLVST